MWVNDRATGGVWRMILAAPEAATLANARVGNGPANFLCRADISRQVPPL